MPKVTKILGNNKARAWESLGFAHKKRLCQHFDTTSSILSVTSGLLTQSESFNDGAISCDIFSLQVIEQTTTFTYQHC